MAGWYRRIILWEEIRDEVQILVQRTVRFWNCYLRFTSAQSIMLAAPTAEVSMDVIEDMPELVSIRPKYTSDMRASSLPIKPEEYTVGFVYSLEMMIHYSPHGHPEQPERISRIHDALREAKCLSKMKRLPIRPVRKEESLLVHSEDHWDKVRDIQSESCRCIRQFYERGCSGYFIDYMLTWKCVLQLPSNDPARNYGFRIILWINVSVCHGRYHSCSASQLWGCNWSLSFRGTGWAAKDICHRTTSRTSCGAGRTHGLLFL